ncbi:hypothetical protein GCM10027074_64680 [Streptomyces deserti]
MRRKRWRGRLDQYQTDQNQSDQKSRSADPGAAPSVTAMGITLHASFLPHDDPDDSVVFCRAALGFEVRDGVGYAGMR